MGFTDGFGEDGFLRGEERTIPGAEGARLPQANLGSQQCRMRLHPALSTLQERLAVTGCAPSDLDQLHANVDAAACLGIIESANPRPALSASYNISQLPGAVADYLTCEERR